MFSSDCRLPPSFFPRLRHKQLPVCAPDDISERFRNHVLMQGCKNSAEKKGVDLSSSRMSVDALWSPGLEYSMSFTSPLMSCESPAVAVSRCLTTSPAVKSQVDSSFIKSAIDPATITKRRQVCLELLETERNYVNILKAIITVFAEPLRELLDEHLKAAEAEPMKKNVPMYLDKTEMDTIFGNVRPLAQAHEKIVAELEDLIENNWHESNLIGKVFVKHVSLNGAVSCLYND